MQPNPPLGSEVVVGALTAFKAAHLVTPFEGDVRFDGATVGAQYGPAYVFQNAIAEARDGQLFIDPVARLIQPLPGTDVPLRLPDDGIHEVLLDGRKDFDGWRPQEDSTRFSLPARAVGRPHAGQSAQDEAA
jgi:hypothetical protein